MRIREVNRGCWNYVIIEMASIEQPKMRAWMKKHGRPVAGDYAGLEREVTWGQWRCSPIHARSKARRGFKGGLPRVSDQTRAELMYGTD